MRNKKIKLQASFEIFLMIASVFAFAFIISPEPVTAEASIFPAFNVCCEKTEEGAWCQNTLDEDCDEDFRKTPTSCEATSFCKKGCCFDRKDGLCMQSTPQKVCGDAGGVWDSDAQCNIPQCELGCCVIGDQASFVTLTRCKRLSNVYGLNTDFRTNVGDEISCIGIAQAQDKGACIYETDEFERTCRFITRGECLNVDSSEFKKDYLCSSEELATNCGKTTRTMCIEGKDEVYFVDSCGNPANIYDASKVNDALYWSKIVSKANSCDLSKPGDPKCGNCDYFGNSICSKGSATYGDYNCRSLECKDNEGNKRKNGESWCVYDGSIGEGADAVGSRHFRYVCMSGEVTIEPCADFRNEVCIQDSIETASGDFVEAACRVNRWRDCLDQKEEDDCLNTDRRDCYWLKGVRMTGQGVATTTQSDTSSSDVFGSGSTGGFSGGLTGQVVAPITGKASDDGPDKEPAGVQLGGGICLPEIPTGLKFWNEGDAQGVCNYGSSVCVVEYEEKLTGGKECVDNCDCLEPEYAQKMNRVCSSLGDCGAYVNYVGRYTDDGAELKIKGKKSNLDKSTPIGKGILNEVRDRTMVTGSVVSEKGGWFERLGLAVGVGLVSGLAGDVPRDAFGQPQLTEAPKVSSAVIPSSGIRGTAIEESITENTLQGVTAAPKLGKFVVTSENGILLSDGKTLIPKDAIITQNLDKTGTTFVNGKKVILNSDELTSAVDGKFIGDAPTDVTAPPSTGAAKDILTSIIGDNAITNFMQVGVAAGIGYFVGGLIGGNADIVMAAAFAAGTFAYQIIGGSYGTESGIFGALTDVVGGGGNGFWGTQGAGIIGIGVAVAIFVIFYEKTEYEIVEFNCQPYQSPLGGKDCEKCNDDELGCTEYRCKSLGQACAILNEGTGEEMCDWVAPNDVTSPKIMISEVSGGHESIPDRAIRPPATGVVIKPDNQECLKAFTPLEFVVATDEPAQCKVDYNLIDTFDEMPYFVGGSNLYDYNHTERMSLPGPDALDEIAPELENDGTYTLYVRCRDANGNFNQDLFSVRFCVEPGPDTTTPNIEGFNIPSGSPVQFSTTELNLETYVNEPSECKWSRSDADYNNMENEMTCDKQLWNMNANLVYTCRTTLTGIEDRKENKYFIRCKDKPGAEEVSRNVNSESKEYVVVGTQTLNILEVEPEGTIFGATNVIPISLKVKTDNGYNNGESLCYYSTTGDEVDYLEFRDNLGTAHVQEQNLPSGYYTYYIKCVDLGGNADYSKTSFTVETDRTTPVVVRTYEERDKLKILTDENSVCRYSNLDCNFEIDDGILMSGDEDVHTVDWDTEQTYYVRCKDEYDNQPNSNRCSIIVKPYELLEQVEVI